MEKHVELALILFALSFSPFAQAQEVPPVNNPLLSGRAEEVQKHAMRVLREEEAVVALTPYRNRSLAPKTQILFFRRKRIRVEVISTGTVTGDRKNAKGEIEILVDIDRDTIIKYPEPGDFALPMTDPNASNGADKKDDYNYLLPEDETTKKVNDRPGYAEFGMGLFQGTMTSTPSNPVDVFKRPSGYRFTDTHIAYYSEYFPIGFEMDSYGGNFPTSTFYRTVVTSSENVSILSLVYRFPTLFNRHLNFTAKVNLLSDQFKTDNTDENLLATKTSGTGLGVGASWEFVSPIWKPEKKKVGFALQRLYGDFGYYPMVSVQDGIVSRGTSSSGSTAQQLRLGFTSLAYLGFIPIFKRFVFQGSYGMRAYSLKFQGPTVSEAVAGSYQIPEGGTSKLTESDFRFFFRDSHRRPD